MPLQISVFIVYFEITQQGFLLLYTQIWSNSVDELHVMQFSANVECILSIFDVKASACREYRDILSSKVCSHNPRTYVTKRLARVRWFTWRRPFLHTSSNQLASWKRKFQAVSLASTTGRAAWRLRCLSVLAAAEEQEAVQIVRSHLPPRWLFALRSSFNPLIFFRVHLGKRKKWQIQRILSRPLPAYNGKTNLQ